MKMTLTISVPPDARWVAVDKSGAIYAFTDKPILIEGTWCSNGERAWLIDDDRLDWLNSLAMITPEGELQPEPTGARALAAAILALNGVEQCDLAVKLARRNPRLADELATAIADALRADDIVSGAQPQVGQV